MTIRRRKTPSAYRSFRTIVYVLKTRKKKRGSGNIVLPEPLFVLEMERTTGFEPAVFALATRRSSRTEPRPHEGEPSEVEKKVAERGGPDPQWLLAIDRLSKTSQNPSGSRSIWRSREDSNLGYA